MDQTNRASHSDGDWSWMIVTDADFTNHILEKTMCGWIFRGGGWEYSVVGFFASFDFPSFPR